MAAAAGPEIERLIALLAKLPGLGPRSARRAALALLKRRDQLLLPLAAALSGSRRARADLQRLRRALDTRDPCAICADPERDGGLICVVEEVGALWAMERAKAFNGRYHVLGGLFSALDGVGPELLRVNQLIVARRRAGGPRGRSSPFQPRSMVRRPPTTWPSVSPERPPR